MNAIFSHWRAWALLSAIFAAMTALLAKIGVAGIDSNFATLLRTLVVVVFLVTLVSVTGAGQTLSSISAKSYLFLALSGLGTALSWLCYFRAIKIGPIAQVATIDKLSIVFIAILSTLFLSEHLSPRNWFGITLVVIGAVLAAAR